MKASETNFQPIIEGTKQYVVPLFQRSYSWDKKEWNVLWTDLIDLYENSEPKSHFIGSIVTMPTVSVPEGIAKYILIDGQQRITTIFILLAVIRSIAKNNSQNELADEISQTMLVNPYKKGADHIKLMPTQTDRKSFKDIVLEGSLGNSQMDKCYQFFDRKIRQEKIDVRELTKIITGRLSVVSIVLDHNDNPHLVFESLNAKGRPLTQADLIRNYFFMRIHIDQQEEIHNKYWLPMQIALNDNLTESIRHYLMKDGAIIKQSDIYFSLKDKIEQTDALSALVEIVAFAGYYEKLLNPEKEENPLLQEGLRRIRRLDVTTSYPFLLNCYNDYHNNRLNINDFLNILKIIENFIVRRFVCNVPTNELNKIFPALYKQATLQDPSNIPNGVRYILQSRNYPKDNEFRSRLMESRLYSSRERISKTKIILESIESSYGHHEVVPFNSLTIEHVMPQKITNWWKEHLGENWQSDHEQLLHTLGNLTLTAYNSELSNDTFPNKKARFALSHISLNDYFCTIDNWNRNTIETRSSILANQVINIWPYFGDEGIASDQSEDITGKKPKSITILDRTSNVSSWRDVLTQTLVMLLELEPEKFNNLAKEFPHLINLDSKRFRRHRQLQNSFYYEVNLSAKSIYGFCAKALELFGLTEDVDWKIESN